MQIGILGAGNIGGTLGKKWTEAGHDVVFGVRDPDSEKVQALLAAAGKQARAASVEQAAAAGQVVVFAIPGPAVVEVARRTAELLAGKPIIDATNRVGQVDLNCLEIFEAHAPQVKYYRAFNTLGWENFARPVIDDTQVDLFYCGDGGETRKTVHQLIDDAGLRPIYIGGREQVSVVDGLTRLWFALATQRGYGRRLAFKMLSE